MLSITAKLSAFTFSSCSNTEMYDYIMFTIGQMLGKFCFVQLHVFQMYDSECRHHVIARAAVLGQESTGTLKSPPDSAIDLGDFYADSIGAGAPHVCAVSDEGQLKCWGQNGSGLYFLRCD